MAEPLFDDGCATCKHHKALDKRVMSSSMIMKFAAWMIPIAIGVLGAILGFVATQLYAVQAQSLPNMDKKHQDEIHRVEREHKTDMKHLQQEQNRKIEQINHKVDSVDKGVDNIEYNLKRLFQKEGVIYIEKPTD